jgi:hypothetical protein
MLSTKRKGAIAVAHAITYFIEKGLTPSLPVVDCDKYDLIVDNGSLKRVQCKYTNEKANANSYVVDLRTFGGYREKVYDITYDDTDFDELFVYCSNGLSYLIPIDKVCNKTTITVGKAWEQYRV